jgi:hypothetical protein
MTEHNSGPEGTEGKPGGQNRSKSRQASKLWVPLVVVIGALAGIATFLAFPPEFVVNGPLTIDTMAYIDELATEIAFQVVFTTVSIALLISLLVVYGRTYYLTKGNFVLGILVVLSALLLQNIITYPYIFVLLANTPLHSSGMLFSPLADVFTVIAYSVFLYLSLQ